MGIKSKKSHQSVVDEVAVALTLGFPSNLSIQPFPQQGTSLSLCPVAQPFSKPYQKPLNPLRHPARPIQALRTPYKGRGGLHESTFILRWVSAHEESEATWTFTDFSWYPGTAWINNPTKIDKFLHHNLASPLAAFISVILLMEKPLGNTIKNLLWNGNSIISYLVTVAILLQIKI